jgi:hypothetical protein
VERVRVEPGDIPETPDLPASQIEGSTMKARIRPTGTATLAAALFLLGTTLPPAFAAGDDEESEVMSGYEARQQAAAKEREKNPAWRPAHKECGLIRVGDGKRPGSLANFCVHTDGRILACWSVGDAAPGSGKRAAANEIRVHAPDGKFLEAWPLPCDPGAICVADDGTIYVGGGGKVVKLDARGQVLASADTPASKLPVALSKEMEEMLSEGGVAEPRQLENYKKQLESRRGEVTGIAVTGSDLFLACPSASDFGYAVWRLDLELANGQQVVDKLRGCCGQMDIQARDGKLWVPHNARHQVECRDRDGKELSKFGKAGRVKPEQFGGCCEPKNLRLLANGEILAAESGPPTCIKRFSAEGKFLGVVGVQESDGNCVRVSVDLSPDGRRFYLLDTERDAILVFGSPAAG